MKHGKSPTMKQKLKIKALRLNWDNYLVVKDCSECFEIVHRITGKTRRLDLVKK